LRLDAAAGTAVKVWEYRPTPDNYAPSLSSAYRLSNGNTLVNFSRGDHAGNRSVVEVDAAGNEVFRIDNPPLHAGEDLPVRYRVYDGIVAIMDETTLRPAAAAPAHVRVATFEKDYYLAKEQARFRELEESWTDGSVLPAGCSTCIRQGGSWYTRTDPAVRGMSGSASYCTSSRSPKTTWPPSTGNGNSTISVSVSGRAACSWKAPA